MGRFAVALVLHPPKSDDKNVQEMFKKCLTDQRFIQKRNTTYKIHTLEDREFQFVYLCSLLSNKQFLTVQNGSKFQIFLLNENHIRPAMFAIFFRVEIMKKNTDS